MKFVALLGYLFLGTAAAVCGSTGVCSGCAQADEYNKCNMCQTKDDRPANADNCISFGVESQTGVYFWCCK
ncbi:hypothetical protein B0J12DRAFT_668546 [Macrophomina phaseolina]|uniref:Uncharacterized protein n=1 Tax=Macrophomina phaseolina TaxID=35725 RepID=A0ABQ8GA30_9PEZI|nr:hypothetical protein B0J12DRAFT_668546 [Macrophomina phaseolina]